jgi:hypothetical protein
MLARSDRALIRSRYETCSSLFKSLQHADSPCPVTHRTVEGSELSLDKPESNSSTSRDDR